MRLQFGDFVIQDEDKSKGYLYVDYESAFNGKLAKILDEIYSSLKSGEREPLIDPAHVEHIGDVEYIVPGINPLIHLVFDGYTARTQEQRMVIMRGAQGAGKSATALRVCAYILNLNDMSPDLPIDQRFINYRIAMYHMVIDPIQLMRYMDFLKRYGLRSPCMILDDAQLFFNSTMFFRNKAMDEMIDNTMTIIRPYVMTTILTLPVSETSLHRRLRSMDGVYLVTIDNLSNEGHSWILSRLNYRETYVRYYSEYRMYKKTMFRNRFVRHFVESEELLEDGREVKVRTYNGITRRTMPDQVYMLYSKIRESYVRLVQELSRKDSVEEAEQ